MCLIAWNWQPGSTTPLLLVANRDEAYGRAAKPLHWWQGDRLLAGQDVLAGGTWLGVDRRGRLAALTNFRQAQPDPTTKPSRGGLVTAFLQGNLDAPQFLEQLLPQAQTYNPFNLLVFDGQHLLGLESRHPRVVAMQPGLGGVSNADFNTPWPKLKRLKAALQQQCLAQRTAVADLLPLLQDRSLAADAELPHTGIALERERLLSSAWIASEYYGTRASSIVALQQDQVHFFEQGYAADGPLVATQQFFTRHAG